MRLKAGHRVNLRLEYIQQGGPASVKLEWTSASQPKQIVPARPALSDDGNPQRRLADARSLDGLPGNQPRDAHLECELPEPAGVARFHHLLRMPCTAIGRMASARASPVSSGPVSGSYTFAVSGDDVVQLYLSTDADVFQQITHRQRRQRHRFPRVGCAAFPTIHRTHPGGRTAVLRGTAAQGRQRHRPLERRLEKAG
jgi:hypothetical protein